MLTNLDKRFDDPPRSFSPVSIWWWSGEKLDAQRLRWQLERFAAGGVYNLLIMNLAPSGPLFGSDPDDPPFRQAGSCTRWLSHPEHAVIR